MVTQYINLIRVNNSVKIINRVFDKKILIKSFASIFTLKDGMLSDEAYFKIKALLNETPNSYISTIYENNTQDIVSIDEVIEPSHKAINLDLRDKLVVNDFEINSFLSKYEINIDFLYSAYSILFYEYMKNRKENSANLLILNNDIYIIIVDNEYKVRFNKIFNLTKFEQIEKSQFYSSDIEEQKLYDEIHYLEIKAFLKESIENYYKDSDKFLESINIYCDIKQLSPNQVQDLKDSLLIDVNYRKSDIDNILFELSYNKGYHNQSLVSPKIKKDNKKYIILFAILSSLIAGYLIYIFVAKEDNKKDTVKKQIKQTIKKEKKQPVVKKVIQIFFPNHRRYNNFIKTQILNIFDTIPDSAYLQKIEISKDETTLVVNHKYIGDLSLLKTNLLKYYKNSETLLSSKNKKSFNSLISATNLKLNNNTNKIVYKKYAFIDDDLNRILSKVVKNVTIKKISSKKSSYIKNIYSVNFLTKGTKELFTIFDILNKLDASIYVTYPIKIEKVSNGLNINFYVVVNYSK